VPLSNEKPATVPPVWEGSVAGPLNLSASTLNDCDGTPTVLYRPAPPRREMPIPVIAIEIVRAIVHFIRRVASQQNTPASGKLSSNLGPRRFVLVLVLSD
jgi:hypothetical protein